MDGVALTGDTVTGTLRYVTGYTGFNGTDTKEQEGNYLALVFSAGGADLSVSHSGGVHPDRPIQLDADGIYILRVSEPGQTITVTKTENGKQQSRTLQLAVTLQEKGGQDV